MDDILVHGRNPEEHQTRLATVLEKLRKEGLTLNYDKYKFFTSSIKFLGHIISDKGISPNLKKVQAIRILTAPTNISELRCFLGMINQLSKFLPHLASKSTVLRELLKKSNQWYWGSCQQGWFEELKKELDSNCLLARYDFS